jgi:hypothetical protein
MIFDCKSLPCSTVLTLQLHGQSTNSSVQKRQKSQQNTTQNDETVKVRSENQEKSGREKSVALRRRPPRTAPPGGKHQHLQSNDLRRKPPPTRPPGGKHQRK